MLPSDPSHDCYNWKMRPWNFEISSVEFPCQFSSNFLENVGNNVSYPDSLDQRPMLISTNKYWSKSWQWSKVPLNTNHFRSLPGFCLILISIGHWSWEFCHKKSDGLFAMTNFSMLYAWTKMINKWFGGEVKETLSLFFKKFDIFSTHFPRMM